MKRNFFKLLVLLGMITVIHAACGGGGNTSNTPAPEQTPQADNSDENSDDQAGDDQASEEDNLPAIVDIYYDSTFKYEDPSLYTGDYAAYTDLPETCSAFFGIDMQDTMTIQSATLSDTILILEGNPSSYTAAPQEDLGDVDAFGYTGTYHGLVCAAVVGSVNDSGQTYDILAFACVTADLSDNCAAAYLRLSDYNFSDVPIKSAGSLKANSSGHADFIAAALRLLRPSL